MLIPTLLFSLAVGPQAAQAEPVACHEQPRDPFSLSSCASPTFASLDVLRLESADGLTGVLRSADGRRYRVRKDDVVAVGQVTQVTRTRLTIERWSRSFSGPNASTVETFVFEIEKPVRLVAVRTVVTTPR